MPEFEITSPEGKRFQITAPDGATSDQVLAYAQKQFTQTEPTLAESLGRQLGLTVRAGISGVTAIPQMVGNAFGLKSTKAVNNLMNTAGLPEPGSSTERVAQDIAGTMASAGGIIGLGGKLATATSPVVRGIGGLLSSQPGTQVVASGLGGAGSGAAREEGAGLLGQTAAGIGASLIPFVTPVAAAGVRGLFRGGESGRKSMANDVKLFENTTGQPPTVGQATENKLIGGLESGMSRFPGGNIPLGERAVAEQTGLGSKVESLASSLSPPGTKMTVGKAIETGITGPGGFMERTKARISGLYNQLDTLLPADSPIPVSNTQRYLDELASGQPGAENLLKVLQNGKVIDIRSALNKDLGGTPGTQVTILGPEGKPLSTVTQGGTPAGTSIPFDAWKQIRSKIGELIGDSQLTTDIPKRQLKALYASMSKDIEAAAASKDAQLFASGAVAKGETPTMNMVNRANTVTKALHDRIDEILQPVMNAGGPENLYNAAVSGTRDGNTKLRTVMQTLPKEGQDALTGDILRRLGRATGSGQTAEGTAFSTERFLTQWSNLSPEAKNTLFAWRNRQFRSDLDQIVKVTDHIRQGSAIFQNPSGSGQAIVMAGVAGGLATSVLSLLTGNIAPMAAAAGTVASTYGASRLMTSPDFVHWLVQSTKMPTAIPQQISILTNIANKQDDPELKKDMLGIAGALNPQR